MLFRDDIDPSCLYCTHGNRISETEVMCLKKGIVSAGASCKKFHYNPLKREPAKHISLNTKNLSKEDFEL